MADVGQDEALPGAIARLRYDAARTGRRRRVLCATEPLTRLELLYREDYPQDIERPRTREECAHGPRPCPWVSCRHHLYVDVDDGGGLLVGSPDVLPWEARETCSLDVAEASGGGVTLQEVAELLGVTRERARQLETMALKRFKRRAPRG